MKICYRHHSFRPAALSILHHAENIMDEYDEQGYTLTLRQLYYQLVARGIIPNRQSEYKKLGTIVSDGRLAGLLHWDLIEDRTRNVRQNSHWETPADILESAARSFALDRWADQGYRPECWIEKDALVGVIAGICEELDIPYFSCRGYTSQSEVWRAARRMKTHLSQGQRPIVFHLGDHDPSGIDMTRDLNDRLNMFLFYEENPVQRIALTMEQIREFNPPPNPAKVTDSRFAEYQANYGTESWELDALEPSVMSNLIREKVEALIDWDLWKATAEQERVAKSKLHALAENWEEEN